MTLANLTPNQIRPTPQEAQIRAKGLNTLIYLIIHFFLSTSYSNREVLAKPWVLTIP
jgi:hypothetical protein